jgi:hypothetical protein
VKDAIRTNVVSLSAADRRCAGRLWARRSCSRTRVTRLFGPDRTQDNTRDLQRYVAGVRGDLGDFSFVKDLSFDVGYTYGKVEVENRERGVDGQRFALAIDSVVDTAGLVNGTPGQIVCRAQLLAKQERRQRRLCSTTSVAAICATPPTAAPPSPSASR